jgi:hypothetical protein
MKINTSSDKHSSLFWCKNIDEHKKVFFLLWHLSRIPGNSLVGKKIDIRENLFRDKKTFVLFYSWNFSVGGGAWKQTFVMLG